MNGFTSYKITMVAHNDGGKRVSEANPLDRFVRLLPTQGGYQSELTAKIVRETKTLWIVRPNGSSYDWKFSKKDGYRTGAMKNEFPKYKIEA